MNRILALGFCVFCLALISVAVYLVYYLDLAGLTG